MARPLPSASQRLVGWLCVVAGGLLVLAQLLRLGVITYFWYTNGAMALSAPQLTVNLLMLVTALLLVYYGRSYLRHGKAAEEQNDDLVT